MKWYYITYKQNKSLYINRRFEVAQIDILKEILDYSLRKFEHHVIGSKIYFSFNNERYAFATLKKTDGRNEYNGISIIYVSKLFGIIDQCDIYFKDVFIDGKRATINVNSQSDQYEWYNMQHPSTRDLNFLAEHVERYMNLIGDFGEAPLDYIGVLGLAANATRHGLSGPVGVTDQLNYAIEQKDDHLSLAGDVLDPVDDVALLEKPVLDATQTTSEHDSLVPEVVETVLSEEDNISTVEDENILVIDNNSLVEEAPAQEVIADNTVVAAEKNKTTENTETRSPLKNLFGRLKNTKEKEEPAFEHASNYTEPVEVEETENLYTKPFVCWNIGNKKDTDVKAALYNTDDKNLYCMVISGSGEMQNFKSVPWLKYKDQISVVKIENGVTSIGNNAFKSFRQLKEIILPNSVLRIGLSAFEFCFNLESVQWPENLKTISSFAFSGAENLKEVNLPDSVQEISDYAFDFKEDFVITHKNPKSLVLGAGISYSDFKNTSKSTSNFSAKYKANTD